MVIGRAVILQNSINGNNFIQLFDDPLDEDSYVVTYAAFALMIVAIIGLSIKNKYAEKENSELKVKTIELSARITELEKEKGECGHLASQSLLCVNGLKSDIAFFKSRADGCRRSHVAELPDMQNYSASALNKCDDLGKKLGTLNTRLDP